MQHGDGGDLKCVDLWLREESGIHNLPEIFKASLVSNHMHPCTVHMDYCTPVNLASHNCYSDDGKTHQTAAVTRLAHFAIIPAVSMLQSLIKLMHKSRGIGLEMALASAALEQKQTAALLYVECATETKRENGSSPLFGPAV